ncbi:MAG: hypothetical protein HY328_04180, partial [Chloroflexi bacterium]|nr:hypothetical protein [Chloroflexota bacterium]
MSNLRILTLLLIAALLISACQPIAVNPPAAPAEAPTAAPVAEPTATTEAEAEEAPLPDLGVLQVAFVPILGSAPFFVAAEMGYFAEQG